MSQATPIYSTFRAPTPDPTVSLRVKVVAVVLVALLLATLPLVFYVLAMSGREHDRLARAEMTLELQQIGLAYEDNLSDAAFEDLASVSPYIIVVEELNGRRPTRRSRTDIVAPSTLLANVQPASVDSLLDGRVLYYDIDGGTAALWQRGDWVVALYAESDLGPTAVIPMTMIAFGIVAFALLISWLVVTWLFRPVGELMSGVEAVGSGDFSHRVPVRSTDELGTLVSAFNAMSEQINMIVESKRRLLFDVSHELRTPLTRMGIVISMLPDGKPKERLERNASELATMITELLENERLAVLGAQLVVESFDLVDLARTVVDSFVDEEDRIDFDTLTENLPVIADLQRMTVALRNIVSNALKYSDPADPAVVVSVFPDDDGARVTVRDHGIGIPEESIEDIFEPFYRTDESRTRGTGGYGLGLSLTRAIIDAHDGTIRAESKVGVGTTITIWIPRNQQSEERRIGIEDAGAAELVMQKTVRTER